MRPQQQNFHPLQEEPEFRQQGTLNFDYESSFPNSQNHPHLQMNMIPQVIYAHPQQVIQQPQAIIYQSAPAEMAVNASPSNVPVINIRGQISSNSLPHNHQAPGHQDQVQVFSAGQLTIIENRIKNGFGCYNVVLYIGACLWGYFTLLFLLSGLAFIISGVFLSGFLAAFRAKKNMSSTMQNYAYHIFLFILGIKLIVVGYLMAQYIAALVFQSYSRSYYGPQLFILAIPLLLHGYLTYYARVLRDLMRDRESHLSHIGS